MLCGIDIIPWNIPHIKYDCGVQSVPQNSVMNLNNVYVEGVFPS